MFSLPSTSVLPSSHQRHSHHTHSYIHIAPIRPLPKRSPLPRARVLFPFPLQRCTYLSTVCMYVYPCIRTYVMALHLAYPCTCMRTHFSSPSGHASIRPLCLRRGAAHRCGGCGSLSVVLAGGWLVDGWWMGIFVCGCGCGCRCSYGVR